MPKKKQVSFQNSTPGKYIPRDDAPSASAFRTGASGNRFNSKMVELLASSSTPSISNNRENESVSNMSKSTQHESVLSTAPDNPTANSAHVHSKVLRRRIVNMLETLRKQDGTPPPPPATSSSKFTSSSMESKCQPITFGQLRQATTTLSPPLPMLTVEEVLPTTKSVTTRSYNDLLSIISDNPSTTTMSINRSSARHTGNSERHPYSPSLEQLFEHHAIAPRKNEQIDIKSEEEPQQQSKPLLTVDEILATYYSKVKVPTIADSNPSVPVTTYPRNNMGFYIGSASTEWHSSQTTAFHNRIPPHPPQLHLNEQKRNRPPPPSYSMSVTSGHRPPLPPPTNNLAQHLIRPPVPLSIREHVYSSGPINQHLLPANVPVNLCPSPPARLPPPVYNALTTTDNERSHSALSSINRPNNPPASPSQAGFDREFSRLLYGGKSRHQRQKRKAFSDPVKKSVEEAGRSVEKAHRRLTTHLNKTDTVTEEEENISDSNETDKRRQASSNQKYSQLQSNENSRDSAKKAIVPANPLLKRRIPSFLRVYAQASASNDISLQWHLFSASDLESYDEMMKKLYKDENLARVQMYENYRALLSSTLASKTSVITTIDDDDDDDDDGITTTAL